MSGDISEYETDMHTAIALRSVAMSCRSLGNTREKVLIQQACPPMCEVHVFDFIYQTYRLNWNSRKS